MKLQTLLTPALALAFASTALAQTDDCAAPTAIGTLGSYGFDTTTNTTSGFSGGGACGGGSTTINQDLFWVFTAPVTADYDFDTFGSSYDTKLSIHAGFDCSATCLGYNDDTSGLQSRVRILGATAGDQFLVQVGGYGSSFGAGTLNIATYVDPCTNGTDDSFEDNDTCLTAVPLVAGNYPGLFTSTSDGDFYRINLPIGEILTVTCLDALTNGGDIDLRLYDSACTLIQDYNTDGFTYANPGATADFIVEIYADPNVSDQCSDYDMDVSIAPDPCFTATDDALEDNDTCQTAVTLTNGNYPGLFTSVSDGDFYRINVLSGDILTVVCLDGLTNNGDIEMRLYDSACTLLLSNAGDTLAYTNVGATADFIVEVYANPNVSDSCTDYDMDISAAPDPCVAAMDDNLEENDDCGQEAPIGSGTFNGLFVSKLDWDYYSVDVNNGDTLQVDLLFIHALGDTDVFLYESGFCQDFAAGNVGCTSSLICGFSASDNESISWTNTTGSTQTYTIKVNVYPPTGTGDCNIYDMVVSGADGMGGGGFGTNYCGPGAVNSSGMPGIIAASGSSVVADNDLLITASQLPDGQFAYLLASRTQGFVANPGGSQGNLCVLGDIARFNRAGEVGAIAGGSFALQMPLGDFPEPPTNGVSVLAGDTWNFQCWHRDFVNGSPTSNFTDAVEVDFQ
ncbi:MAG: hypothetical protein ACI9HE_001094 [Planctomycetota bacterium]|jgi:hypothetical protein